MKKITLLLLLFLGMFSGYGQALPQNFDAGLPADWVVKSRLNGTEVVQPQHWQLNTAAYAAYSAPNAAFINNEQIGIGNTEEDYLITATQLVPTNGQMRFWTRQTANSDENTIYQIRVSTTSQTDLSTFTTIQTWTEAELTDLNGDITAYEEKAVNLDAYVGGNIYIAFVRMYTQPGTQRSGDRWLVDDVRMVQKCGKPTELNVVTANIGSTTAPIFFTNTAVGTTNFEIEFVFENSDPTGVGIPFTGSGANISYTGTGLVPGQCYKYYVRAVCDGNNPSDWAGPLLFCTKPLGSVCSDPIVIPQIPYQTSGNTANYGDDTDVAQGTTLCGAIPVGTNYLAGNEVYYTFTAPFDCNINVTMTPVGTTSTNSSVFMYGACPVAGTPCLGGVANSNTSVRSFNVTVTAGTSYTIVISSGPATQTIAYNLLIQCENCNPKPTALTATPDLTSATLSWTNAAYNGWQVAVQDLGALVPDGLGVYDFVTTPTFTPTNLVSCHQYQYWVRSECAPGSGIYSAWAGPVAFNTKCCADADRCNYTFVLSNTANGGWHGARMIVRQNGIDATVGAPLGSTLLTGQGPVSVTVPLCPSAPFDVFWTVAGSQPNQTVLKIVNALGQTIYTKPAGTGSAGSVIYNSVANTNCTEVVCDIPPTNVTVSGINTSSGTINFTAPAQTLFDVYVAIAGGPDPDINTTPTYAGITSTSFTTTIPLLADTTYQVCVRSACGTKSVWVCTTFTTLPTCPKPLTPTVDAPQLNAGVNSALAHWFPGVAGQSVYDLILVPGFPVPAPPSTTGPWDVPGTIFVNDYVDASATPTYLFNNLPAATIYYFYVRTVCPGNDNSTWTGPFIFNTVTCDVANKCQYKFILTDSGANGWNGGKIQVRQNGIIIQTLALASGAGPSTVNVSLCTNVPFDLFWSVAGTAPEEIGVSVQNPFTDIIFTKAPGVGTPLTVVYDSVGNCTAPTCPKPTALSVSTTTPPSQTTATLTWTPGGTETQWEIYAVPVGSPLPVNGSPVSTTPGPPYFVVTADLALAPLVGATITGLQPGTNYIYYIRALCSSSDVSTWTILNPKTFTTKPVNDDCAFATNIQVNPVWACDPALNVAGNTLGATASSPVTTPPLTGAGCGLGNRDVWFTFTATSVNQVISINNIVGTPAATVLNYSVLTGACDNLTRLYCSTDMETVATGLTVGQVYYIRVYTSTNTPANSAAFTICVNTPPPPGPNDECANAINVPVNETPDCILTTPGTITGATPSAQPVGTQPTASPCFGNANDDVWFTFVANSGTEIISLLNVVGTTENLNFAVYSGNCGALTRLACSAANSLTAVIKNLTVDNTYYIRVWSNEATGQVAAFNVCVKPVSSCQNAAPFCGSSIDNPYIFANTTDLPDNSQVACLGSIPNPTFYTLHIDQAGDLAFNIQQYDDFDPITGAPIGATHDVDFVAWGPFDSVDSETGGTATCSQIAFTDCPTCPNNQNDPNFYPFGNIVDCSYSASFTEDLTINNAVIGQFYVILVTNFSNQPGKIRLVQTNFGAPGAGTTVCCNVALGPDISLCAANVTLNALTGITDLNNVPSTFEWYFNDSATPIPGETSATYLATVSGTYTVKGTCGLNPVDDTIVVVLSPPIETTVPADYVLCDDPSNDGIASFDLQTLAAQILGPLDATLYTLTYHLTPTAAETDQPGISITTPLASATTIIYVRVESNALATCYNVVPVNLVVQPLPDPTFSYSDAAYCKNIGTNPIPTGVAGTFTAAPTDLVFVDASTGEIDLLASPAGTYDITNTIIGTGVCADVTYIQTVTLTDPLVGTFHYEFPEICTDAENPAPILDGASGVFTATPAGLIIDATTGVIDLASPIGTYTVYNTIAASGGCGEVIEQTEITITPKPDASFIFGSAIYCKNDLPNPTPSFTTGTA
ncbi:MAG: choice-of-anchor J domain-containing protein, partial [Flavobacterium sp.]|nr:choice-of-anchor J domain-containing protein [Flavobacterium sp.]